ncbi:MAG: lysophospholipase [Chloroflexi bacterium]|nr:lysophospholipase [Chloroflexota bacterium]
MTSIADSAATRDGVRLLTRHWAAGLARDGALLTRHWPEQAPRGAVLLVHGLGEHSGRYEEVGARLAAAGLETFAWDQRGYGASGGERAWADNWSRLHDDLQDRLAATRAAVPGRPVVVFGHSLGGLIALGYCVSARPLPDLLVLSAPGIDDSLASWKRIAAPVVARVAPRLRIADGINSSMRSRDADTQKAVDADPLMQTTSTTHFGALIFAEQPRVRAEATRLSIPTLVIHGEDDSIVPVAATEFLGNLPGVTRKVYPGVRHELHNEPEGPSVLGDVIAWIEGQLGSGPA